MMLISHLFGDASGPYLIGMVSDMIRNGNDDPESQYYSLIKACFVAVGLLLISAALYFVCSLVLIRDQAKFREEMGETFIERIERVAFLPNTYLPINDQILKS